MDQKKLAREQTHSADNPNSLFFTSLKSMWQRNARVKKRPVEPFFSLSSHSSIVIIIIFFCVEFSPHLRVRWKKSCPSSNVRVEREWMLARPAVPFLFLVVSPCVLHPLLFPSIFYRFLRPLQTLGNMISNFEGGRLEKKQQGCFYVEEIHYHITSPFSLAPCSMFWLSRRLFLRRLRLNSLRTYTRKGKAEWFLFPHDYPR